MSFLRGLGQKAREAAGMQPQLSGDLETSLNAGLEVFQREKDSAINKSTAASGMAAKLGDVGDAVSSVSEQLASVAGIAAERFKGRAEGKGKKETGVNMIINAINTYLNADKSDDHIGPLTTLKQALDSFPNDMRSDVGSKVTAALDNVKMDVDTRWRIHQHLENTIEGDITAAITSETSKKESASNAVKKGGYTRKIEFLTELQRDIKNTGINSPGDVKEVAAVIAEAEKKLETGAVSAKGERGTVPILLEKLKTAIAEEMKHTPAAPQPAPRLGSHN